MDFKRDLQKLVCTGIELNSPVNLVPPGKFPYLKNVRSFQGGVVQPREGMQRLNTSPLFANSIHTLSRMNDYISVDFIRFVGIEGTLLAGDGATYSTVATGMSASTYGIVPYRPDQAVRDWAYVMSSAKSLKVNGDLTTRKIGVKPPNVPPEVNLILPNWSHPAIIQGGWVVDGDGTEPVHEDKLGTGCAVDTYFPDGGNSAWASVIPTGGDFWNIAQYDLLWIGGQGVVCEELHYLPEPTNITQVASSVQIGAVASIQPVNNIKGLRRNSILQVGSGTMQRVIAINKDSNQINSFQYIGSAGAPGATCTAQTTSFRVPDFGYSGSIAFPVIATTVSGSGQAKLTNPQGIPGYNLETNEGRTFGPDDYFTFSIYCSDLKKIDSVRVLLDIDKGTVSGTPTDVIGTKNALYHVMGPDDFVGNFSWKTVRIRISELIRIGGDDSCSLADVRAVQLTVIMNPDNDDTNTVDVKLGSIYTSGGFGPDTGNNDTLIQYRYRYRASETGARSNPGPASASGIVAQRQGVHLNVTASSDPQVDKIDIERFGGTNLEWHYIATVANENTTYVDGAASAAILNIPPLETDRFETFPVVELPFSAIVNCAGVYAELASGPDFNPNWARGTEVIVNTTRTTLASAPIGNKLIFNDSVGGLTGVEMDIAQPVVAATTLPVMWGPFYDCLFGCGDQHSPGTLYFTNPSDPDSAADINTVDITTPSEKLMNGCLFDGHNYCWSDKRMFGILPIDNPNTPEFKFQYTEVPTARGLWAEWAFTVGPKIWYLSSDGIYETAGGEPVCISMDIAPLFPQGENPGIPVNGMQPVLMGQPGGDSNISHLRLCYHNGYLYFDYLDVNQTLRSIVYDVKNKAWFPDTYFENTTHDNNLGIICRFSEYGSVGGDDTETLLCGSNRGIVYLPGGFADDEFPIYGQIDTPAKDFGDSRAKKIYGDIVYEMNSKTETVNFQPWLNNYATSITGKNYSNNVQAVTDPQDLSNGIGVFARNLGVRITWHSSTKAPQLFSWEPSYLSRPEDTFLRADDWSNAGYEGSKFVTGFLVEADTEGATKTVAFEMDQGVIETYEMTHNGQTIQVYSVKPQAIGSLVRLRPLEAIMWREFKVSWIYEKYPELSDLVTPYEDCGFQGAKLMRGVDIEALGGPVETIVEIDGGTNAYTLELDHSGITALHTKPYAFRKPFIATELRLNPATAIRLGKRRWIFDPYPDFSPLITPYLDGGYDGAKFVQGFKLEAAGHADIEVQYDGDQTGEAFDCNHTDVDGVGVLITKAYSFQTPIIAHELRLSTVGNSENMRIGKITWVFEEAPELVTHWVTQGTSHGIPGYMFLKDGYIALQSTADVTLTIIMEGIGEIFTFVIPSTGGQYKKNYLLLGTGVERTLKDKLFRYRLDSAEGFRLFQRDCEVRIHAWGGGDYVINRPFGDVPGADGAKI